MIGAQRDLYEREKAKTEDKSLTITFSLMTEKLNETLINSADEMKHEAHGAQQPRHINKIGEDASTAQRSDSLV